MQAARHTVGLTFAYAEAFQAEADRLLEQEMTDAQFFDLIRATFGTAPEAALREVRQASGDRLATLSRLFHDASTQSAIRGTAWAGYQAVTEYVDHFAPVRTKVAPDDARAQRLLMTEGPSRTKRVAWDALTNG